MDMRCMPSRGHTSVLQRSRATQLMQEQDRRLHRQPRIAMLGQYCRINSWLNHVEPELYRIAMTQAVHLISAYPYTQYSVMANGVPVVELSTPPWDMEKCASVVAG